MTNAHANLATPRTEPGLICRVPSGWVLLCPLQFLRGYCILESDPVVDSINALEPAQQSQFMLDMVLVGDALLEITGAYRINYALLSNSKPILHAHIVPRFLDEADHLRNQPPWFYPNLDDPATRLDYDRDRGLIADLAQAIGKRLAARA